MNASHPIALHEPEIWRGDALAVLDLFPDETFDCCVTSPPYWGLRDYKIDGQVGLEPTMAEYIASIVKICREIRRVLKTGGTFWLVIGDSYARSAKGQHKPGDAGKQTYIIERGGGRAANEHIPEGLKEKDLCMIPNRVALALQDDGWWVRSEIVWHKPNPMPESVRDRPTNAHEKIWLLTKSARYFYDADAIRTPMLPSSVARLSQNIDEQAGSKRANGESKTNGPMRAVARIDKQRGHGRRHAGFNDRWGALTTEEQTALGSNARNVWSISPAPFRGAHFATFPPALVERCLKAGCPVDGHALDPFAGSGTTGFVARRLSMRSTLIELSPAYCDIIRMRLA